MTWTNDGRWYVGKDGLFMVNFAATVDDSLDVQVWDVRAYHGGTLIWTDYIFGPIDEVKRTIERELGEYP